MRNISCFLSISRKGRLILSKFLVPAVSSRKVKGAQQLGFVKATMYGLLSLHLSAASTPLLSGDYCGFSHYIPTFHRSVDPIHVLEHQKMSHNILECIRCALAGMYADVPFACDAAYIQIPYD
ncbi:hypothetical protein NC652_004957 [Populus alba x Populus x berolinensis]|nr:hypothetical protein NC652_004957 [Populus alba x Populus x berolinensis]